MTGVLAPVQYGQLALAMTATMFAQQAVLSPLSGGVLRFFSAAEEASATAEFFGASRRLVAQATMVLAVIFAAVLIALWLSNNGRWMAIAPVAFLFSMFAGYAVLLDGVQNAARQRLVVAWHAGLNQWLRFLIAYALCVLIVPTSTMAMIGYTIGAALVLVSQWIFFRRRVPSVISSDAPPATVSEWQRTISRYAWPIGVWGIFYWCQAASDRWSLEIFRSTAEVGRYAVLYQLGYYPVILINSAVLQLISP
ncbi:MAG: hypothetical protein ACXWHG_08875, partial [Thermoanaerobaculia bacterium]